MVVMGMGCAPGRPGHDALMAEGRTLMEHGEAGRALEVFIRAQQAKPDRRYRGQRDAIPHRGARRPPQHAGGVRHEGEEPIGVQQRERGQRDM